MADFKKYLDETGEIGVVEQVLHSVVYVKGLPSAKQGELVVFESGEFGQILSLNQEYVEVLILSKEMIDVGEKLTRTNRDLQVGVSTALLGNTVDPLGRINGQVVRGKENVTFRRIDIHPSGISSRKNIDQPFETGVSLVDLIIPIGRGQRELIIGDRKTGKTLLLIQSLLAQAKKGTICIYGAIAKKRMDVAGIEEFIEQKGIKDNVIVVSSSSSDPPGLVFITPYTAMTIAEYFRDMGKDVLVLLDDLTAHAKYYREISLLAKRFPGRSSYPGDIFYIHSRLLERAGNFIHREKTKDGKIVESESSITCLPVAELVLSDFTGYIQSNLMAMTDGHIFYDSDLYTQGRRPAINPFLSVTRVGRQAQTPLMRDLNRQVTSFLVYLEKLREFMHFGAELSEATKRTLALGDRITAFFDQVPYTIRSLNANVLLISALWAGFWKESPLSNMKKEMLNIFDAYDKDPQFKLFVDNMISSSANFSNLIESVKANDEMLLGKIKQLSQAVPQGTQVQQ